MKNGSNQFDYATKTEFCSMCGAIAGDFWQTRITRPIKLRLRPRANDPGQIWIICDECDEGLRGLSHKSRLLQA